jgi:RNA polymerase sigma-70 factor (ECF subfamily)
MSEEAMLRSGSEEVASEIAKVFVEFRDRLRARARKLGVEDVDIDDVVSEALRRACEHTEPHPAARDPRSIRRWLLQLVKYEAMTYHQNRRRSLEDVAPDRDTNVDEAVAFDPEARDLMLRALKGIRPEYREVLRLHDLDGLTLGEVAEALQINQNTAQAWLRRGREALRQQILLLDPSLRGREERGAMLLGFSALGRSVLGSLLEVAPGRRARQAANLSLASPVAAALLVLIFGLAVDTQAAGAPARAIKGMSAPAIAVAAPQVVKEEAPGPVEVVPVPAENRGRAAAVSRPREDVSAWRAHAALARGQHGRALAALEEGMPGAKGWQDARGSLWRAALAGTREFGSTK